MSKDEKYNLGRYINNQLQVLLESENGPPKTWDSYEEIWKYIHEGNNLPSHDEIGFPIGWVILPPKKN